MKCPNGQRYHDHEHDACRMCVAHIEGGCPNDNIHWCPECGSEMELRDTGDIVMWWCNDEDCDQPGIVISRSHSEKVKQ